jgi:hypothetical protein
VVALNGHSEFPALDVLRHVMPGQMDEREWRRRPKVYSEEFHHGIMRRTPASTPA